VIRTVSYFLVGAILGWLLVGAACYVKWQTPGLYGAAATGLICLIPTTLSLLLALWSRGRTSAEQLSAIMGGMALRIGMVLGLGLTIFLAFPYFKEAGHEYAYWGSLLFFYLFTLGWETFLLARPKKEVRPVVGEGAGE
jgi:hypothetical protein